MACLCRVEYSRKVSGHSPNGAVVVRAILAVVVIATFTIMSVKPVQADEQGRAKLVVLVFFDQFRGDYLGRWESEFEEGGFKRLMKDGARFDNCHYPYAYTVTGAGHASVSTGCVPADHGIVGNDWFERSLGKSVNCVGSDRHEQVLPRSKDSGDDDEKKGAKGGVSPERLLKPTLADALKLGTGGKSKVVSLSLKNRGASLPGGKSPDACYWMDSSTGLFVTSNYYRDSTHHWITDFNKGKPAEQWRGKTWDRLRTDLNYAKLSGPDDMNGESRGASGQGRVFPHPFEPSDPKVKPAYLSALYASPYGNELLINLAEKAILSESLGTHDVPDLLTLSFSSNDAVGHAWGPDSQEVLDTTLRSDRIMKRLLDVLDTNVGKGKYVLAMTADHGICPLPEVSRKDGHEAGRVQPATAKKIEAFLTETYGKAQGQWVEAISGPWIYLNARAIRSIGIAQTDVEGKLAEWLSRQDGVRSVYSRSALVAGVQASDEVGQMILKSFHPARCGDVYVLLKPYYLTSAITGTGTTHGSPYEYDTHVPLVVFGTGVKAGVHKERISPLAATPILAEAAGIQPPTGTAQFLPKGLITNPAR